MSKIFLLSEQTACRIAAGEVIDRPVAVVKELIENAIDAGATSIRVAIGDGGIDYITVIDNGSGISQEDVPLAFQRHATSKISDHSDLNKITTLGFRGEALPSIASVADMTLKTRIAGNSEGYWIHIQGGHQGESGPVGCPVGTSITVRDLFFNTPARRKYLKSKATESGLINDLVSKMALINPHIRFSLEHNQRQVLRTTGSGRIIDALVSLYGPQTAAMMVEVRGEENNIVMMGYVGKPELSRSTRQQITLAVNGRMVRSPVLNKAMDEAYRGLLTVGRFPVAVLLFTITPEMVDVNIHPSKMEIKIDQAEKLEAMVSTKIRQALQQINLIPSAQPDQRQHKIAASTEPYQLDLNQNQTRAVATPRVGPDNREPPSALPGTATTTTGVRPQLYDRDNEAFPALQQRDDIAETRSSYQEPGSTFPRLKFVEQVLATYIVAEDDGGIYFIDQHAAHERILFEKYYSYLTGNKPETQYLLTPIHVSLQVRENDFLLEHLGIYEKLGFLVEYFGTGSWLLRGIPADYSPAESEQLFMDLTESLMETGTASNDRINYTIASMMACKASVKGGQRMSPEGMQALFNQLAQCQEPYTCPHGRPTIISLTRHQLERMFKRT